MSNGDRKKRLNAIFNTDTIRNREADTPGPIEERELRLACLLLGHEIERSLFVNRFARRQAVMDHARAFMDFVRSDESKDAEE